MAKQYEVTYRQKGSTIQKKTKLTAISEQKAKEIVEKMGGGNTVITVKPA